MAHHQRLTGSTAKWGKKKKEERDADYAGAGRKGETPHLSNKKRKEKKRASSLAGRGKGESVVRKKRRGSWRGQGKKKEGDPNSLCLRCRKKRRRKAHIMLKRRGELRKKKKEGKSG